MSIADDNELARLIDVVRAEGPRADDATIARRVLARIPDDRWREVLHSVFKALAAQVQAIVADQKPLLEWEQKIRDLGFARRGWGRSGQACDWPIGCEWPTLSGKACAGYAWGWKDTGLILCKRRRREWEYRRACLHDEQDSIELTIRGAEDFLQAEGAS